MLKEKEDVSSLKDGAQELQPNAFFSTSFPLYSDKCYILHEDHRLAELFDYTLLQIFSETRHQGFSFSFC